MKFVFEIKFTWMQQVNDLKEKCTSNSEHIFLEKIFKIQWQKFFADFISDSSSEKIAHTSYQLEEWNRKGLNCFKNQLEANTTSSNSGYLVWIFLTHGLNNKFSKIIFRLHERTISKCNFPFKAAIIIIRYTDNYFCSKLIYFFGFCHCSLYYMHVHCTLAWLRKEKCMLVASLKIYTAIFESVIKQWHCEGWSRAGECCTCVGKRKLWKSSILRLFLPIGFVN